MQAITAADYSGRKSRGGGRKSRTTGSGMAVFPLIRARRSFLEARKTLRLRAPSGLEA